MSNATPEQRKALAQIANAVLEAVEAAGHLGAPSGPMYAALMSIGITLAQYEALMDALVGIGKLEKRGDLYFTRTLVH